MNSENTRWTTLAQVRTLLDKKWRKGHFLKEYLRPMEQFPLRVPIHGPVAGELHQHYEEAREWVQQWLLIDKKETFRIEWLQINNRVLGQNILPVAVLFDSAADTIRFIGKVKEYTSWVRLTEILLSAFPALREWAIKNPFSILEHASDLNTLINITHWRIKTPKPGIYLRQLHCAAIDTKFVEKHKKPLGEWFDYLLDTSIVDTPDTGIKGFERRYGFLEKPLQIRFRILDSDKYIHGLSDLTITEDEFCTLNPDISTVFVTENDINGLAFPMVRESIVLFGRGYGFDHLKNAIWLKGKEIWYWGDIDTHGFAILNQFRGIFPQTQSMLMDRNTLTLNKQFGVREKTPGTATLENLTDEENAFYDDIRHNRIGDSVRLEQEYIPYESVIQFLAGIGKL